MGSRRMDLDEEGGQVGQVPDHNTIDPNDVDQLLSRELASLDVQGREAILEEVHGVRCITPEETPLLLETSLARFNEELESIHMKPAFDRSQELASPRVPSYVNTDEFRLRFLRCELFDAKKASARMCRFLDTLMELFDGKEELLLRPPRILDFSKTECAVLKSGNLQLLPYRDRSGRRILTVAIDLSLALDFVMTAKILYYFMLVASESVESQRRGLVKVLYPSNFSEDPLSLLPTREHQRLAAKMNASFPIRLVAMHICHPDTFFFRLFRAILIVTKYGDTKFRVVSHYGLYTEWQYQLMGYGIPIDLLPISPTGNIKTLMLQQWLRIRKMKESQYGQEKKDLPPGSDDSDDSSVVPCHNAVECPNLNDVVFRPGKSYMIHPGNVMFRSLIESKIDEHFAATRSQKAAIAWSIVREVELKGGRFLKWDNRGWWTEFEDRSDIRYKIPTYFRDFTRNNKARKQRMKLKSKDSKK
mmetsp:Transcript_20998/g.43231  ORF Transcript_20998/g.43231 Transcript_20998/m.43231 type:complete len:475 (+) Transcript_20998:260-1684(+)|eukprot:CAMPEP_0197270352 /NCGR_PEP_ID=MMETSP1432-20130617/7010_1 /TAXON_ID=44447 /ORGANISM="Pseudo-nitzschia delicatissima, Strain UNC1205" /LENGTH=474 /DNA_ID=CAMNT_0042735635 /DNA_START=152 /DNA_END=1576 /DNA_ORIENTATION=+